MSSFERMGERNGHTQQHSVEKSNWLEMGVWEEQKNDNAYRIPLNIYRKWFWFTIAADCWTCVLATLAIQNEKKATNKKWGAEEKSMRNKRVHMCVCPRSFFCSVLFHFLQMNQRSWSGNQKQLVLWTKLVDKMTQNEMCASGTPTHVRTYVRTHNTHSLVHK